MASNLLSVINYQKAYRENRYGAAQWVLKNQNTIPELLEYGFGKDPVIAYKANWVLEFVCLEKLELIVPHFDFFFLNLDKIKTHQSLRAISHICEIICIAYYKKKRLKKTVFTSTQKHTLVQHAFDWLITPQKVACQARAMFCLYFLGTEIDWVHPELITILERNASKSSAGYKARAKKVIALIDSQK